jgi:hypothetical protein
LKRNCTCGSLTDALDELAEAATKAEITKAARALHKARNPKFKPLPNPQVQPEPSATREEPVAPPRAPAELVTETSTRPFRRIHRVRRWFDGPETGRSHIEDRQF